MAYHGSPSCTPSATIFTIPGCLIRARARISLRMLSSSISPMDPMVLKATILPLSRCWARYTTPIPPLPRGSRMLKAPMVCVFEFICQWAIKSLPKHRSEARFISSGGSLSLHHVAFIVYHGESQMERENSWPLLEVFSSLLYSYTKCFYQCCYVSFFKNKLK